MNDLYWITVLGNLSHFLTILLGVSGFALILLILHIFIDCDENESKLKQAQKYIKILLAIFAGALLLKVFTPSKTELYVIHGVGGSVDYLKNNETAKHLPDKYIKILDKWADEQLNDSNKNE